MNVCVVVRQTGVCDHHALEVVVLGVVLLNEMVADVRDVETCIRLASEVDLLSVQVKGVDEVVEEASKHARDIILILLGDLANGEASANGLVDVEHVRQVGPGPWVLDRAEGAVLPQERAVLLQETLETAASGAAVQPDEQGGIVGDVGLAAARSVGVAALLGEEPEVQVLAAVAARGDGQQTSVRLANVKGDIGQLLAINGEGCVG